MLHEAKLMAREAAVAGAAAAAASVGANNVEPAPLCPAAGHPPPEPAPSTHFHSRWAPGPDEYDMDPVRPPAAGETMEQMLQRYKRESPVDNGPGGADGAGGGIPDMSKDPLDWWRLRADQFPLLARVARKYLSIPAASAAAERLFSYTGFKVGKLNSNLDDDMLLSMVMIRALTRFCEQWGYKYGNIL